jgi:hypothetical protein
MSGRSLSKSTPPPFDERSGALVHRLRQEAQLRVFRWQKRGYQFLPRARAETSKKVVFIFGCQRSGTTLLLDVFTEDLRTAIFPEVSELSRPVGGRLRLRSFPELRAHIGAVRAPVVVLKPIVESQNATRLLDGFPGSSAIWVYRDFGSVAASDLELFGSGNGILNLQLLLSNDPPNWRAEVVPPTTRDVLTRFFHSDMPPHDAAALFWWARNSLFFDLGLQQRSDVLLCRYEELVSDPDRVMRRLYRAIGIEWPKRQITVGVRDDARVQSDATPISPDVRNLCQELLDRLVECSRDVHAGRTS